MNNLFIYGDSHAYFSFKDIPCYNFYVPSVTMFRVGRDNTIINFNNIIHNNNSVILISYGEVDCRCHIKKQIELGRDEDEVICSLITNYFNTINNNVIVYKHIIVVGIIPTTKIENFELLYKDVENSYPFVGTNDERVRFTNKMNELIQKKCGEYGYIYFYPYSRYTDIDGCLNYELSDKNVHIENNQNIMYEFHNLLVKKSII